MHIISNEEKHDNISLFASIIYALKTVGKLLLFKYCYSSFVLEPFNQKFLRAKIWRILGCKVGNNVRIGHSVALDYGNTDQICIEDYKKGMDSSLLPFLYGPVKLCKGSQIGMGAIIMPGVTIGEGAIIGAGAVVTHNIPAWTIAVGSPAKVIKEL